MKSVAIQALVLSAAAFASVSSFAEGRIPSLDNPAQITGTKTRADVKNELLQAQRNGFKTLVNDKAYPDFSTASVKSRAQVMAELDRSRFDAPNANYIHR